MSATPFDKLADDYDAAFTRTVLGSALRDLVWERFGVLFQSGQRVLELGCGTGEDAARLAQAGIDVVATDPSVRMLEVARTKLRARGHEHRVEFYCARMEDVPRRLSGERFSGVVSNFGALNCIKDVPALARDLADICAPDANLLLVVMGRHVPWEWAWYAARGQPRKALRRLRPGGVEWRGLRIRYPTPREVSSMLEPFFAVERVAPLGFALPPSYAGAWLERSPRLLNLLSKLERRAHSRRALAGFADHFIIEATRVTR